MCPVPFNSARAFVALGSWLMEGTKYVCRQGLLWMDLLLTAVGVEKREWISSWSSFYSGHHVTPMGCWYSVKQDHQFLNKISIYKTRVVCIKFKPGCLEDILNPYFAHVDEEENKLIHKSVSQQGARWNSQHARLANLHKWVRFSLDAQFIRPCATSQQKA